MIRKPLVVVLLVTALGSCLLVRPLRAGFIADSAKSAGAGVFGLIAAEVFSQAAGAIYNNTCKVDAPSHDAVQLLCETLGSVSGVSEEDWRNSVSDDLAAMKEDLAFLKQGQAAIQARIDEVKAQNRVLLSRMDELADEVALRGHMSLIRTMWEDEFLKLFDGRAASMSREKYQEQLVNFAERVVAKDLATVQGRINDLLARGGTRGGGTLLQRYAQTLSAQMDAASTRDVRPTYEFFESVVAEVLFVQRQGFLMYVWAAEVLESQCELDPSCPRVRGLAHTSADYPEILAGHVAAQVNAFNNAFEWLVLSQSDPHSVDPQFLAPNSAASFERADIFTGANLNETYSRVGIRGRVISMGDQFDGKLRIGGRTVDPIATELIESAHGALDWWRWTGDDTYGKLHREVSFANQWKIYRYHIDLYDQKKYAIGNSFPHAPEVEVYRLNLRTGVRAKPKDRGSAFGSFTAIERGGGGYGLLSGKWSTSEWSNDDISGLARRKNRVAASLVGKAVLPYVGPKAGVESRVLLESKARPSKEGAQDKGDAGANSLSFFRYREGGELVLNLEFSPDFVACSTCNHSGFATKDTLVAIQSDYRLGGIDPKAGALHAKVRFVLNEFSAFTKDKLSTNGFVTSIDLPEVKAAVKESTAKSEASAPITLTKGRMYAPSLRVEFSAKQWTVGLDASSWKILAQAHVKNAYLTKK